MEEAAECMLVLIGATPEGKKELVGFQTGVRESAQSWRELLIDIKQRGLEIAPDLAVGDGALGFWKAIEQVCAQTASGAAAASSRCRAAMRADGRSARRTGGIGDEPPTSDATPAGPGYSGGHCSGHRCHCGGALRAWGRGTSSGLLTGFGTSRCAAKKISQNWGA